MRTNPRNELGYLLQYKFSSVSTADNLCKSLTEADKPDAFL